MPKSTVTYWNPLAADQAHRWVPLPDTDGLIEQLTLAEDLETGHYTRLTRFKAGANTTAFGPQSHDYPEEILVISGRLYDTAFDLWLETGHYASRPPGEVHGPFMTDSDCVVLECSYPGQGRS